MSKKIGLLSDVQAEALETKGTIPDKQFITFVSVKEALRRLGDNDGHGLARWVEPADPRLAYQFITPVARVLGWGARSQSCRLDIGSSTHLTFVPRGMSVMQPVLEKLR